MVLLGRKNCIFSRSVGLGIVYKVVQTRQLPFQLWPRAQLDTL